KVTTSGSGLEERIIMRSEITPSWDEYPSVATSVVIGSISQSLDDDTTGTLNVNTTVKMTIDGKNEWFRRDDIYTGENTLAQYSDDLKNLMMRIRETDLDLVSIDYIDVSAKHNPERMESRIEGMSILTIDEIKQRAEESKQENNDFLDVFDDLEMYQDPKIDEDDPEEYILKNGSLYLAAVKLVNYRAPRETVYVPFYLPPDFKNGKGRIIVRSGSGEMPSSHTVGEKVNTYTKKWLNEHFGAVRKLDDGITAYFDRIFESNRGNSLVFEIVHEKYDPAFYDETKLVRVEIMRANSVKGIWEHPLKIE
ncbi:hypothetical protein KKB99_00095, partial [bacterium]|nr:hypothetical protein [bacterium]MBU1024384.1 hypothetical protein [bacterium]